MNFQDKKGLAKMAVAKVFEDPSASADERRAALAEIQADIQAYLEKIPYRDPLLTHFRQQYEAEKAARKNGEARRE